MSKRKLSVTRAEAVQRARRIVAGEHAKRLEDLPRRRIPQREESPAETSLVPAVPPREPSTDLQTPPRSRNSDHAKSDYVELRPGIPWGLIGVTAVAFMAIGSVALWAL